MPGVWNINSGYNVNTKKISSKLTFEVGERFTGKVVSKGDGKDITIKLSDGWQFIAETDDNVNLDELKLVKFQVDGFQNGKLKLKLMKGTADEEIIGDENFQGVIEKEGLSKEDINVLKKMVNNNISLTKDNINEIKGLFQFNEKMSSNPKEIDSFIQTYLQSKDISVNSEEGQVIKESLTKFLDKFKDMTQEDILVFVENNMDFSEENINSFNKLFKGGSSIEQILVKISDSLKSQEITGRIQDSNIENVMNNKLINEEVQLGKNTLDTNAPIELKGYNENDSLTKKIKILDVLKTLVNSKETDVFIKTYLQSKGISSNNTQGQAVKEMLTKILGELKNMTPEDIVPFIENNSNFSEENINNLNKAFQGESSIEKILIKISDSLKSLEITDSISDNNIEIVMNNKLINEEPELAKNNLDTSTTIESKDYNENDQLTKKIKILDVLKTLTDPKENNAFIKTYLQSKDIQTNSIQEQTTKQMLTKFLGEFKNMIQDVFSFIESNSNLSEENINSLNKSFQGESSIEQVFTRISNSVKSLDTKENIADNNIETVMNNKLINKQIELTKNNLDTNTTLASKAYNENDPLLKKINILDVLKTLADSELDTVQTNAGKEITNSNTNIEKENLSALLIKKLDDTEVLKLIKDTIGNSITTDDTPKTQAERLIEASNKAKLESILSTIDGKEVKLTEGEFKALKQLINNKSQGIEVLRESAFDDKNIIQSKEVLTNDIKETAVSKESLGKLNTEELGRGNLDNKESIKAEMKDKIDNIRDIVKSLITQIDSKETGYEKIMNLVKANINDFKVFNSISDEYYYLNIPITADSKEYPCKLIIKDNRKDGKKIDSTNTKMVVSIKTINLGEVDGYLTMRENKIDVKLKCESDFASVLNNNKSKLVSGLATLGLFVNVSVSTKDKTVDLVSCRNFFNNLTISTIDIKV